jgi:hypothetical protein
MSIYGIGGGGRLGMPPERAVEQAGGRAPAPATQPEAPRDARGTALGAANGLSAAALPSAPPPGTDPELWSVLTTEERVFYARSQALGPLTYGRDEVHSAQESIGRGGRLDLRV